MKIKFMGANKVSKILMQDCLCLLKKSFNIYLKLRVYTANIVYNNIYIVFK